MKCFKGRENTAIWMARRIIPTRGRVPNSQNIKRNNENTVIIHYNDAPALSSSRFLLKDFPPNPAAKKQKHTINNYVVRSEKLQGYKKFFVLELSKTKCWRPTEAPQCFISSCCCCKGRIGTFPGSERAVHFVLSVFSLFSSWFIRFSQIFRNDFALPKHVEETSRT